MSTVESIVRPRSKLQRRRALKPYISKESLAITGVVEIFFNDTATTEIYTLSLHDALPISTSVPVMRPRKPSLDPFPRPSTPWTTVRSAKWNVRSAPSFVATRMVLVATKDGAERTFHFADRTVVHGVEGLGKGSKEGLRGLITGTEVEIGRASCRERV